jgi:formylmethanofuran dehydrogenase subunit B
VPFIAVTTPGTTFAYSPKVRIDVGTPGQDHDAIEWARDIATFTLVSAKSASDAPKVAEILGLIDDHLTKGSEVC